MIPCAELRPPSSVLALLLPLALATGASGQIAVEAIGDGLGEPILLSQPSGDSRLFVLDRLGTIRTLEGGSSTTWLSVPNVSTDGEGGLLGMAFAPDFETSGELYLNYTVRRPGSSGSDNNRLDTVIARVTVPDPDAPLAGSASFETVLRFNQPFTNHNAGWIGFAPEDTTGQYLYVPTGDGGSSNDPGNRAQSLDTILGKVLRLDVSGADDFAADPDRNYAIPGDNHFAADGDAGTLGEIVAYGLRNPYRVSFDRGTGHLFIGDVGQGAREEISVMATEVDGQNFGWRLREGDIATPGVGGPAPADHVPPIFDYARSEDGSGTPVLGGSVTGGYVYRGSLLPEEFQGLYFFADFVSGRLFTIDPEADDVDQSLEEWTSILPAAVGPFDIAGLGEDATGELYLLDRDGEAYAIVPEPGAYGLTGVVALLALRQRTRVRSRQAFR